VSATLRISDAKTFVPVKAAAWSQIRLKQSLYLMNSSIGVAAQIQEKTDL
jgi:hypothetical protein